MFSGRIKHFKNYFLNSFQGQKRRNEKQDRANINRIRASMINLLQRRLLDNDSVWNTLAPPDTLRRKKSPYSLEGVGGI